MSAWRALVSQDGCHVVYLTDDFGRLVGIWATEKPEDFHGEVPISWLHWRALTCSMSLVLAAAVKRRKWGSETADTRLTVAGR